MGYNVFIAFCAFLLSLSTFVLLGHAEIHYLGISLVSSVATFAVYAWLKDQAKWPLWFMLLLVFMMIPFGASFSLIVYCIHLGVIAYWYGRSLTTPIFNLQALRSIPFFKAIVLGYTWASVTVILPVLFSGLTLGQEVLHVFVQRLFFIAGISFVFDVRDLVADKKGRVATAPLLIGVPWTKRVSMVFLFIYLLLVFYYTHNDYAIPLLISGLAACFFVVLVNKKRQPYYYAAFLDGCMAFQGAMIIAWLLI
ncbi:hypothetical protein RCC89_04965 [Cytophagaceae bacterium ABcell3]|nr:hypothetical protein RCC89_04965 [Cytophagaceae bacterium ABcell3]